MAKALLNAPVLLGLLAATTAASPIIDPDLYSAHGLPIMKTTVTPSGQVLDWVPIEAQGHDVAVPASLLKHNNVFTGEGAQSELLKGGVELGPAGTVPIPRLSKAAMARPHEKSGVPGLKSTKAKRQTSYSGTHWYVNSGMDVTSYGSSAYYSLFEPYIATNDFSLLQTALVCTDAASPFNPGQTTEQTLEAGWINIEYQNPSPHIFTYYTTNGYTQGGDYMGGWNTEVKGWVQISSTYYPGVALTDLSSIGGAQNDVELYYQLTNGNYYLMISGSNIATEAVGYYPAALYSNNTDSGSTTLADGSNYLAFYGEIEQFEDAVTTTDMGSGEFGTTGYGQSAYIRNMLYYDESGNSSPYTAGFSDSTASNWDHGNGDAGGSDWGNYIYLGGPGEGGNVGS